MIKDSKKEPIFLVGCRRSGTTFLRLMLSGHSEIAYLGEFNYATKWISDNQRWPEIEKYYQHLERDRIFQDSNLLIDKSLTYPALIKSFETQALAGKEKKIFAATVHDNFDQLIRIWPDAYFIHIVRDGRDVARSYMDFGWAGNGWCGCREWIEVESKWNEFSGKLKRSREISITYEGLIEDCEGTLKHICSFVGINYERRMTEYDQSTIYKKPDRARIGQWKTKLSPKDVRQIEARAAHVLVLRSYELTTSQPRPVRSLTQAYYWFDNKLKTLMWRQKTYGPLLILRSYAARLLHDRALLVKVAREMHEIERGNLK